MEPKFVPRLLMIVPAPVNRLPDGQLRLDVKFVEGMRLHCRLWKGTIGVVLWDHGAPIPFGATCDPAELPFTPIVLSPGEDVPTEVLGNHDSIAASADMVETLDLPRRTRLPVIYSIEYTIGTRLRIVALDRDLSWPRKVWSMAWNIRMEARRRRAFRKAAGLQANGYPAYEAYRRFNPATILYLDGRMRSGMLATPGEMAARAAHLRSGAPLRIAHSGRLEAMKGAQDLVPVMRDLHRLGVPATLDIFGSGTLEPVIRAALPEFEGDIRLHGPVDFETELVPWMKKNADLFLSCHRQSDPSCTYLESMGCGVPVIGYDNDMWAQMQADSGSGWVLPMGKTGLLAEEIARLEAAREQLVLHGELALEFARHHDFESEFKRRMMHRAVRRWEARTPRPTAALPNGLLKRR